MPLSNLAPLVEEALGRVIDPEIRRPITELGMVGDITVDAAGRASVAIKLTIVGCPAADRIERDVREATASVAGVTEVALDVSVMTAAERTTLTERLRGGRARVMPFGRDSLTRVYAVTSGKGGVGKSTLTANLAVSLAARGLRVGLIDADVHGFSIPGILGLSGARPTRVGDMILPPVAFGVKTVSIGMFLDPERGQGRSSAVAWRGPMLHRTIEQFLTDVYFGDLDVLLLDLPPGTGDIAISVGQLLPNSEVIVITTPQPAAAEVAVRSGALAAQTGQHVYGVVENMAGLVQADGTVLELFGSGGGGLVAEELGAPLLGQVPLSVALRAGGDAGTPIVVEDPTDAASVAISRIAEAMASRPRNLSGRPLPMHLG